MMAIETKIWDPAELLRTPEDIAAYLDTYLEDGDSEEIREALRTIARSQGMTALARKTGLTREALYKALGENGNPTLDTLVRICRALGLRLSLAA
ncbi:MULTISPECIES: addiction module antidote protein [Sphingopyxis]|jgi:probable addiction module antidote protein|uniref:Addiction module antitoxin n=2 Tax=Sphingopyxis granuli TaxID=267128 RepID=A0AA86L239_9SPHN|nr:MULTISPECIES: addiction module antidote protein [Sphingopyxis]AMG73674.1 Addiction module antitoxin [Sphingopyxis granuli]APW72171.1 putative addiction module antidote protein [Sphingopyxis granuli]AVA12922.1 putative addiction module antidote protein [Sphingopyxis sp. MG]ODU30407.1 MAG: putative addiction module antidote protein [Sphingopyxis sp. SCN 67-31]